MPAQHRPRRFDRNRIEVERDDAGRAEPCGRDRMQAGAAADVEKRLAREPLRAQQANQATLGLRHARVVDDGGIAGPVLPEGEMGGDVFQRS